MRKGTDPGVERLSSRPDGFLWSGYRGDVRIDALQPYTVIDRCAASVRDLEFRVEGGGTRIYGLRPLTPERSTLDALHGFFKALQESVQKDGVKLPILVWGVNNKLYVRYGASRVYVSRLLGATTIPAVLCNFGRDIPPGFEAARGLFTPAEVLEDGFGGPVVVGDFEHSFERLDAHRMEV